MLGANLHEMTSNAVLFVVLIKIHKEKKHIEELINYICMLIFLKDSEMKKGAFDTH